MESQEPQFKTPLQKRSRESLKRVYDATNDLLRDKDFDQITISQISKASSVAVGSIYQRFGSKDQLLWIMYQSYLEKANILFINLLAGKGDEPRRERIENFLTTLCDLWETNRGIIRSLLVVFRRDPEEVPDYLKGHFLDAYENSAQYLLEPNPTEADIRQARFVISMLLANCREHIFYPANQWGTARGLTTEDFKSLLIPAAEAIMDSAKQP